MNDLHGQPEESERLNALRPTIDSFRSEIRDARIGVLVLASLLVVSGIGIIFTSEPPNLERKRWFGAIVALVSLAATTFAILAPAAWIRRVGNFFNSTSEIEEVLNGECKSGLNFFFYVREFGVAYLIMIPIMLGGIWVWEHVSWIWGAAICIPTGIIGVARIWYIGSYDAVKMLQWLDQSLPKQGYKEAESFGVMLLQASFVNGDNFFEVEKSWQKNFPSVTINWCKYNGSGDSIQSGIACVCGLYGFSLLEMAEKLKTFSSVYYDKSSESIYGTMIGAIDGDHSQLGGVPWQYKNCSLVARFDSSLLKYMMKQEEVDEAYVNNLINACELFASELASQ